MALRSVEGAPAWLARVLEEVLQILQPLSARIAKLKTKTTPPPPPVMHSPEPGSETRTAPGSWERSQGVSFCFHLVLC